MKKTLNTDAIKNELAGSVFFPHTPQEPTDEEDQSDTVKPRHHATKQP